VFHSSEGVIDLQIPLVVEDAKSNEVPYSEKTVRLNDSYFVHESTQYSVPAFSIQEGVAHVILPKPIRNSLLFMLNLEDPLKHYLPLSTTFVVPSTSGSVYRSRQIKLLTKDGAGCQGAKDSSNCFLQKQTAYNDIEAQIVDMESERPVEGVLLELSADNDDSMVLASARSDSKGMVIFKNAANDYYTLRFKGDGTYLPAR
jgi:hypothetical protein